LFTAAAIAVTAPHFFARPHVLALPLMVIWTGGLVRALDEARPPSLALLPVMTLWANLHGGFTAGLALIVPVALEAVLAAATGLRHTVAIRWMRFALLACIAACITPYGPESILMTYRILSLGQALSFIPEWQSHNFTHFGVFEACLLIAVGLTLHRGLTLPPFRIIVVLGLLHLALAHVRNTELLTLLAPIFLAAPLARQLGANSPRAENSRFGLIADAAILTLLVTITSYVAVFRSFAPPAQITPTEAVRVLGDTKAGPVFNDYSFGGYLIYAGIAPFMDGRAELYGEAFLARAYRAVNLLDVADFLRLLDEYRIGATLLPPDTPAVGLLDRLPGWKRLYADDIAIVHVRESRQATTTVFPTSAK
jgi:hypothetical protein